MFLANSSMRRKIMFHFDILSLVAAIPGLLMALVIHEYAHALIADKMGDSTPRMTGRLTLNPIAHIDPIGLIMLLVAQFGWAKPVMINANNFRNWRKGEICVSLAEPFANFILALVMFAIRMILYWSGIRMRSLDLVLDLIIIYNINFGIFNLIPLPPLDGSRLITVFLPTEWAIRLASVERYSFLLLIVLMATPVFSYILIPLQRLIYLIDYTIVQGLFYWIFV